MNNSATSRRSLQNDPQYFGVFANMARHNAYNILCEIADRAGLPQPATEENLSGATVLAILNPAFSNEKLQLGKINRPDKCSYIIEKLNLHFRFLPAINQSLDARNPDSNTYYEMMCCFLDQLDATRNQYTHAIQTGGGFNNDLVRYLDHIFDYGLSEIIKRFQLEEADMKHLRRYDGMDRTTKKPRKNPAFQYRFYENNTITEKGLAFFICLFLEPAYSALFLKKLYGFKGGDSKAYRSTFDLYILSRCMLPQQKLESTGNNKTTLLLDMLNELQRCPKELYETLSPEDQKKFETAASDAETEIEEDDENKALLLRKKNRFPYFALRYIDLQKVFKKLRFQVDLGNYHFHSYEKQMDDQPIVRHWEKKLLSFGRLHELSERAKTTWGELIKDPAVVNDETPAPFILKTEPHYHFIENNIALKDSSKNYTELPALQTGKDLKTKTQEADYYLATDELTGLLLYQYFVEKYNGPSAEDIISKYKENISSFLQAVANGKVMPINKEAITDQHSAAAVAKVLSRNEFEKEYKTRKDWLAQELNSYKLEPHMVPEKICKYLMRLEPVDMNERAEQLIKFQLDETEKLLQRAGGPGSKEKKKNKKLLRKQNRNLHLSAGDSGLYLAKDMLYLQPPAKDENGQPSPKGKANPDEFQLLQARLAFFGAEKASLERTFRLCKLIGDEKGNRHPFLHKVNWMECEDSLSFYIAYLEERKEFFKWLLETKDFSGYYFLTGNEEKKDDNYLKNLAAVIDTKPVNLPRGLFKDALVTLLQQKGEKGMKELVAGENVKHNAVFLVNEWYKLQDDGYQPFYDTKRNYRTVDEWVNDRPGGIMKPLTKQYKTTAELTALADIIKKSNKIKNEETGLKYYKAYSDNVIENEKLIRHYRACDQMLFIMCRDMLAREDDKIKNAFAAGFNLEDISPDNPKSILETRITFTLPVQSDDKRIKYIEEEFKVKDYGKLRKYLKDRRLRDLLMYFDEERIKLPVLKKQLEEYEKYRLMLFDCIAAFEKACNNTPDFKNVIETEINSINKEGKKKGYVGHTALLNRYAKLNNFDEKDKKALLAIRNAFSHNLFPSKDKLAGIIRQGEPILSEIMNFAVTSYQTFTNNLTTNKYASGFSA